MVSIYCGISNVVSLLQVVVMVVCLQKLLDFLSSAFSDIVLSGPSVESLYIYFLKSGLRDVRPYTWLSLTAIICYIFYMQVKEAFTYRSVDIFSEFVSCGPSDVSCYIEWSAIIRCGLSDERSHIFSMLVLLLYDHICNIGTLYFLLNRFIYFSIGGVEVFANCALPIICIRFWAAFQQWQHLAP